MKICIIGAGSTYTPELIEGIINRADALEFSELVLMDIDEKKLKIVGGLAKRMTVVSGLKCKTLLTANLDQALKNSNFVLCQIRVGKLPARILDEKIPLKYGIIGQETMGIGGFFKAQRTIPVMMHIANKMMDLCPDAWLINFTNPSGIVAEAILKHTNVKMLGLCNVPFNMKKSIGEKLGLKNPEFDYLGLNHLSWITSIRENGIDYLKAAIEKGINSDNMKNIPKLDFTSELIRTVGAIPSPYLGYVYYKDSKFETLKNNKQTRGEKCVEIEEELLKIYSDSQLHVKPKLLESRGGANYSFVAISLVDALYNDKKEVHVVNTFNNGALHFMEDDDVVEIGAVIGKKGAETMKVHSQVNQHIVSTMHQFKTYERYSIKAALTGDKNDAIRALMANPLVYDYNTAKACFDEMLEAQRKYLPQYK